MYRLKWDLNILYFYGFPITSLTEHRVLKLTNQYHPMAKSSLEYFEDRPYPLYSSVFTYFPLVNLLNIFLPLNTIFMQTTLKFTQIVTNHIIFTFKHVSLLLITGSPITIYYLTPIRHCSPPNSLPTTIFPQIYLGHTLIPPPYVVYYINISWHTYQ